MFERRKTELGVNGFSKINNLAGFGKDCRLIGTERAFYPKERIPR
jgi:hypothetical protein